MEYLYLNNQNKKEILQRQTTQCEAEHYEIDLTIRRLKELDQQGQNLNDLITHLSLLEKSHDYFKTELGGLGA